MAAAAVLLAAHPRRAAADIPGENVDFMYYGRMGIGWTPSGQVVAGKYMNLGDQARRDEGRATGTAVKLSIAPTVVPTGERSAWARPEMRLIYTICFYNQAAVDQRMSPYLQAMGATKTAHFLGARTEWRFQDSLRSNSRSPGRMTRTIHSIAPDASSLHRLNGCSRLAADLRPSAAHHCPIVPGSANAKIASGSVTTAEVERSPPARQGHGARVRRSINQGRATHREKS